MSHRTEDLPPLTGVAHGLRELRYHEGARQVLAVALIVLYAATAAPLPLLAAVGLALALAGAVVRLYASGFIVKNQELATDGAVSVRAPPALHGQHLARVGFALAGSRWWGMPLALLFFWFYYPTAIEYEDRKLRRIFGPVWEEWAARTPALLPRVGGSRPTQPGDRHWSFAVSNQRNGELVLVVFSIAVCIAVAFWVAWRAS